MLEKVIQKKIIDYLEEMGAYVVNVVQAGKPGTPDIVCSVYGLFVGIEVKRPGHKPRPLQEHHLEKILESHGHAIVATSVEEVREFIAQLQPWRPEND